MLKFTILTTIFGGLMTTMCVTTALIAVKLIKNSMKKTDDFIIKDGKTGAELYDEMINALIKNENKDWQPAFYDIDSDFIELNGEQILYNEEDQE